MKRIIIHTACADYIFSNTGSFLQHWALRKVLKELGYSPSRDCLGDNPIIQSKSRFYLSWLFSLGRTFLHYSKNKKYSDVSFNKKSLRKYTNFLKFKKDYIKYIGNVSEDSTSQVEAVILGGDQILYPADLIRILNIPANKHIIYTASADWTKAKNSEEWISVCKTAFQKLKGIGVREKSGVDLINTLGYHATHVADPVMQLPVEQYIQIASAKTIFAKNTLFCYILNTKTEKELNIKQLKTLANSLNTDLKICGIQGTDCLIPKQYYLSLCPTEFLKAIMEAQYIITNSYHGTVLAIMFHKPFISLKQKTVKGSNQNTRQQELLSWLNLEHHHIERENIDLYSQSLFNENIDWERIDKKIESFRNQSIIWLKETLE